MAIERFMPAPAHFPTKAAQRAPESLGEAFSPRILVPYDRKEAIDVEIAADIAQRSATTIRAWCARYFIGRRVAGGPWQVSRLALAMLLDGDEAALKDYLRGDRTGPLVLPYAKRAGLSI